jgi:tetratricopeptide (TPR) repeat protein
MEKGKTSISIVILSVIFIAQFLLLHNNSFSGYVLNPKNITERNNVHNIVYAMAMDLVKVEIPRERNISIDVITDNSNGFYDVGVNLVYDMTTFYPNNVIKTSERTAFDIKKLSDENIISYINSYDTDYIIVIGDNVTILGNTTSKDITLFKVEGQNKLKLILEFDLAMYDLYNLYVDNNQKDLFSDYFKLITNLAHDYSTDFTTSPAIEYIYDYATAMQKLQNYDEALKYYSLYMNYRVDYKVYYNRAQTYMFKGNYQLALSDLRRCLDFEESDKNEIDRLMNNISKAIGGGQ